MMATNWAESIDLLSFKLLLYVVVLGVIPSYWVYKVEIVHHRLAYKVENKLYRYRKKTFEKN
jgi:lipid A ethanolaminephosphotransferase